MKTLLNLNCKFRLVVFCSLSSALFAFSKPIINNDVNSRFSSESSFISLLPDSTLLDTIQYEDGDTITFYVSGQDTTFITYQSESEDSVDMELFTISASNPKIIVQLSDQSGEVNMGLIGINLTDIFEPLKTPQGALTNYAYTDDPWEILVDLAPSTIRIFSGASAKFMHPMGGKLKDAATNEYYGGYGYDWKEMLTYYDITDGELDAPTVAGAPDWTTIEDQMASVDGGDLTWVSGAGNRKRYSEFYDKCMSQPTYNPALPEYDTPEERPLYINQLIDLVDAIETGNPGHEVNVIYCVNIESGTTEDMIRTIDYLELHGVHVAGIELGNEVMSEFHYQAMGFLDFDHYWNYINGDDYTGLGGGFTTSMLEDVLPDDVEADHDYIQAIKGDLDYYEIKIGLPAANTPNCGTNYDFPLMPQQGGEEQSRGALAGPPVITVPDPVDPDCGCEYPQWNVDMQTYFDKHTTSESVSFAYKFDAVILHTYYTTTNNNPDCTVNSNWQEIMLPLHPSYPELSTDLDEYEFDVVQYTTTPWTYSTLDTRLSTVFNNITGVHTPLATSPLIPGNFKEFTRDRLDNSFTEHANWLDFLDTDDGPETKEIWITEYNIDEEVNIMFDPLIDGADDIAAANETSFKNYTGAVANTFSHAFVMHNWFLWMLKANFDNDYRNGFLTTATLQNYLGGSPTMMTTKYAQSDIVGTGVGGASCATDVLEPYFIRRTTSFPPELWRVINDNGLKYLRSNSVIGAQNDNLAPTVFIDDNVEDPKLYVFYSNVKPGTQWFGFDPAMLDDYFDLTGEYVDLTNSMTGSALIADQLYSTSGDNPLFGINDQYNTCANVMDNENYYELTTLETISPNVTCPTLFATEFPAGVCAEVPGRSIGYFVVPIDFLPLKKGDPDEIFIVYPNPTSNYFTIQQKDVSSEMLSNITVELFTSQGDLALTYTNIAESERISIESLPVGVYMIKITYGNNQIAKESIIKMK